MDDLLICKDVSLKKHCGYRTGGAAELYFEPWDLEELKDVLRKYDHFTLIGAGYNTLIRDGGVKGLVLKLASENFKKISLKNSIITVGSGVLLNDLLTFCSKNNLGGLEYLAGIPGTVGGAIKGNAGAFQRAIGDNIVSIHAVDKHGEEKVLKKDQLVFSYRSLKEVKDLIFTNVELIIEKKPDYNIAERIDTYRKQRSVSNLNGFTCGSVFKNPRSIKAWKLIEKAGLRGHRIGSARVFDQHCNWIVADKDASSEDIEKLINCIKKRVKEVSDVDLCCEIVLIGNKL